MTKEDFFILKDKIFKEEELRFKEAKELWKQKKPIHNDFLHNNYLSSVEFEGCYTPSEMINAMTEFLNEIKELNYHVDGRTELRLDSDDGYVYNNDYRYFYKQIISESQFKSKTKLKLKYKFEEILQPSSQKYSTEVDCKLMELYKDGNIDFKTLQKLVYTNCNL